MGYKKEMKCYLILRQFNSTRTIWHWLETKVLTALNLSKMYALQKSHISKVGWIIFSIDGLSSAYCRAISSVGLNQRNLEICAEKFGFLRHEFRIAILCLTGGVAHTLPTEPLCNYGPCWISIKHLAVPIRKDQSSQ